MTEERLARTIDTLNSLDDLVRFETNARKKNQLTEEMASAIKTRAAELGRILIVEKTGLDLSNLSQAEEKIVQAVSEYTGIVRRRGKYPGRTFAQLQSRGLRGAAETAVCKTTPAQGFQGLADAGRENLSYEQIVVDHADEFSPRAVWYSRRTLGLPNDSDTPPAALDKDTQTRTALLVQWLKNEAEGHGGLIPRFTNGDAATVLGIQDMAKYGRVLGNIQSRVDFACYVCDLPPLGLAAEAPFAKAWAQHDRNWAFPVAAMRAAAQSRIWSPDDFDRVLRETRRLGGQAHKLWQGALSADETKVKAWALGLGQSASMLRSADETPLKRNPPWSRDELILALGLYLRHRASPPGKNSPEVAELSAFLNMMGQALGLAEADTYRNANGVYMKMMNFRRFDAEYTRGGRVGLTRGNKDEEAVWGDFSDDPARLSAVAAAIRSAIEQHRSDRALDGADEPDIQEAEEGRVLTRLHRMRERSKKLVESKKKAALKQHGRLFCEACGFDFSRTYGPQGKGLIDVHHTKPVHTLSEGEITKLEDLALLCANCHRVVHSSRQWLTVEQVRDLIRQTAVHAS